LFKQSNIPAFFQALQQQWPQAKTELEYDNIFQLLVAVVLSAQATDKSVNKVGLILFKIVYTPDDILNLGEEKLKSMIKAIGLYNAKARNLMALSRQLIDQFNGQVPDNRKDLESLPGVGRKTASVVLNVAFNQPTIAIDTHIFRLCNRTDLAPGRTPYEVEMVLNEVVPTEFKMTCHHLLILHGRYVCVARKPLCSQCCVNHLCQYNNKNL